jgi:hypothetical protein
LTAAHYGDLTKVQRMLADQGHRITEVDDYGYSVHLVAALGHNIEILQFLLDLEHGGSEKCFAEGKIMAIVDGTYEILYK